MGKFIYAIENGNNNGYIWVYHNDGIAKREEGNVLLNLFSEEELIEAVSKFKKVRFMFLKTMRSL